ncbi:MAG TPA: Ig-like domain-containing protein [Gemmatimonadaceae bacterium]|nr:Ig-like domain-containing protein [Gemmatimonadaceae bacterium]
MRRLTAAAFLALGCASPGMPPGGPPDVAAPQIIDIAPDSGRVGITPKEVRFRFDEVVAERPPSVTTLADLFLISPRDGTPNVGWHRDEISVRPRRGWRPNTTYTVIMLRGLSDIRGNVRNSGASTFFSTGSNIPATRITGRVFDWASGAVASGALVEAFVPPDSIHAYIALVDSTGAFAIERAQPGTYLIRAFLDRNKNQAIDLTETWDSSSISLRDSLSKDLFVFVHDTIPPRVRDVVGVDSVTLRVTFDKPIDPTQTLSVANFSIVGPDSARVPLASAGPAAKDSSVIPTPMPSSQPTAATSSRLPPPARRDTIIQSKAVMPRVAPISDVVIKLQRPLAPKTTYHVRALQIRGLLGATGDSERTYTTPAPTPVVPKSPGTGER